VIKIKQETLKKSLAQLLTDYELTELEINTLFYIQGAILSRALNSEHIKKFMANKC
jgi:hypothetical protein